MKLLGLDHGQEQKVYGLQGVPEERDSLVASPDPVNSAYATLVVGTFGETIFNCNHGVVRVAFFSNVSFAQVFHGHLTHFNNLVIRFIVVNLNS